MKIVIAQIKNTKGKLEAARIYDTVTKEVMDMSIGRIRKAIFNDEEIIGFGYTEITKYNMSSVVLEEKKADIDIEEKKVLKRTQGRFSFERVPVINGAGEPKTARDKKLQTVIGWSGFCECKKFHLINYKGDIEIVDSATFTEKVRNKTVNGAAFRAEKLIVKSELNIEVED